MRGSTDRGRPWRVASAALIGGAALLAFSSGDPLLILAVLSAAGGLFLLARPARARHMDIAAMTAPDIGRIAARQRAVAAARHRRALPVAERATRPPLLDAS